MSYDPIGFGAQAVPPELQAELDAWERAGDEAWALIDEWERQERPFLCSLHPD